MDENSVFSDSCFLQVKRKPQRPMRLRSCLGGLPLDSSRRSLESILDPLEGKRKSLLLTVCFRPEGEMAKGLRSR